MAEPARYPAWAASAAPRTGVPAWPHPYYPAALAELGKIFIVVIDTSVITGDVIKTVKGGLPSPLLLAMRTGLVRGCVAANADFRAGGSGQRSGELVADGASAPPGDGGGGGEVCFAEDG